MTLASHLFLLLYLPVNLFLYYIVLRTTRRKLWLLLVASALFYALAGWQFLPVLYGLSYLTFRLAAARRTGWGIFLNLLALVFFKFAGFGISHLNELAVTLDLPILIPILSLTLPLGMSFYVFKHIGYLIDTHHGRCTPTTDFLAFAVYSSFFAQVSAGPIHDFKGMAPRLGDLPHKADARQIHTGLLMIGIGLVKKVLIADAIRHALPADAPGSVIGLIPAWYLVIAFALQLYFDFSGYTDMALGVARLFGFDLPANFNNPYCAVHVTQFWERWHMSLSNWFRLYLFSPLSRFLIRSLGPHAKDWAQVLATIATMMLIGLWHGSAWTYLLWGAYHGLLLVLNSRINHPGTSRIPVGQQRVGLIFTVTLGWAVFMSPDLPASVHLLGQMFAVGGFGSQADLSALLLHPATPVIFIAIAIVITGSAEAVDLLAAPFMRRRWTAFACGLLVAISIISMGSSVDFLYMAY